MKTLPLFLYGSFLSVPIEEVPMINILSEEHDHVQASMDWAYDSTASSKSYSTYICELLSSAAEESLPDSTIDEDQPDGDYWSQFVNESSEEEDEAEENTFFGDPGTIPTEQQNKPIYPGHWLTVHCALVLVLTYSVAHAITGSQLSDLLTLVSYFMLESHPAFKSIHMFKKYFADIESPLVKHYYCSKCFSKLTVGAEICPNEFCTEDYRNKKKSYFIEMPITNQIRNLFARDGFVEKLQHRFTRKRTVVNNIEDLYDGILYKEMFENNGPLSNPYNISFCWNTDGIPVFKSSKFQLWPMYLAINELHIKYRMRKENMIFAGLWFGESKPVFSRFSQPLLKDLVTLENHGIDVQIQGKTVNSKAFLLYGCADLPARSAVLNMNQFNGNFSCTKCLQSGKNERTAAGGNIHVFPYIRDDPKGPTRTDCQCVNDAVAAFNAKTTVNGIKGPSFLMAVKSYSFVKGTVIDYMHGVILGVSKVLINLWFSSSNLSESFSLYSKTDIVDSRLLSIKVTYNISRVPRAIGAHFKYWKASELRSWLLYYSLPILVDLMDTSFYYHFSCFVEAIHLLSGSSISSEDLEKSYKTLTYFVLMFEPLYGIRYCGLNLHSLLHLPDMVRDVGPLWSINCFGFEDANGQILKLFHGTQNVDVQIMSAVNTLHLLPQMIKELPANSNALTFINKMQNRKHRSPCSIFPNSEIQSVGKGYTKVLSSSLFSAVIRCLGEPPQELVFYNRLLIRNNMFHSSSYSRVAKRNSYTVKYLFNGEVRFGCVIFYAENQVHCTCELINCSCQRTFLAFIKRMESGTPRLTQFNELHNISVKVNIGHIHEVNITGFIDVINVKDILQLCLDVYFGKSIDDTHFVCEFANTCEFD